MRKLRRKAHQTYEGRYSPFTKRRCVSLDALGPLAARRKLWGRKRNIFLSPTQSPLIAVGRKAETQVVWPSGSFSLHSCSMVRFKVNGTIACYTVS